MWNEICEGLCARGQGGCRVAVCGEGEPCAAFIAGAARVAGVPFEEGKAEFACGGGKVVLTAGGAEGADAVLLVLPASASAAALRAAAADAGAKPCAAVLDGSEEGACAALAEECGLPVTALHCEGAADYSAPLRDVLFAFPATELTIDLPDWMCVLPAESKAIEGVLAKVREVAPKIVRVRDFSLLEAAFGEDVYCASCEADPATGRARCRLEPQEGLFHRVLSEECGADVSDDLHLMAYVGGLREAKRFYERFKNAVAAADAVGYGIAAPSAGEVQLAAPELVRKGSRCGVRLKADAPAYHIIKVDVHSEVTPVSGEGERGEQLAKGVLESYERDPETLWNTDMFGKTFREMVQDGLRERQGGVPEEARIKLRRALTRIVNEGKGGVLCILL